MMFKNESDVVARKAEKRYETLAKQTGSQHSRRTKNRPPNFEDYESWNSSCGWPLIRRSTATVPFTRYPTPESIVREIIPSIEDQALGFFVGNYVARPTIVPRGQFEWVTELLAQPNTQEILRSSVNAASLAAFANATKSPIIMQQAQAAYGSALRITNSALRR